jgi:hypothetical protein
MILLGEGVLRRALAEFLAEPTVHMRPVDRLHHHGPGR